jgi:hypothetical protein
MSQQLANNRSSGSADKQSEHQNFFDESSLVGASAGEAVPAKVDVIFTSGIGQLTASLFRNGLVISLQSISASGAIIFPDVLRGDVISINGVCTGEAIITIDVSTDPITPVVFAAGNINAGYDVI